MTNAVIYARSSADCPASVEEQIERLKNVAANQSWTIARVFSDHTMPTKRKRERRPGEAALMAAIRSGGVDKVLTFSIDRPGRSLAELVGMLEACRTAGVDIYINDLRMDTANGNGLSLFDLGAMMACHLRQSRRDKILRGQAVARSANVRFGRPPLARAKIDKVERELASGRGVRAAARVAGISPASVSRIKAAMDSDVARV
jgi:DNA invertase Pin-like site-specific DNA recombinase